MENTRTPILIFFNNDQITSEAKNLNFSYPEEYIFKEKKKIFVFLNHAQKFDQLQKNHLIFNIGMKLHNFCKKGTFYIDFFGDDHSSIFTLSLGWALMDYSFDKFKKNKVKKNSPKLAHSHTVEVNKQKKSIFYVRDLINNPANILGPKDLYLNARNFLAKDFKSKKVIGKKLEEEFPLVSFVGRGSEKNREPLLCEFTHKNKKSKKKVILIGKGVTFDTGGLNLKLGNGMSLMKKDMGGAANSIGLANLISQSSNNFDLVLLLALVENSLSAKSMRPSDIVRSRKGDYIEIGDTDAEGRLILADAITYALELKPDLIIDLATLTGASRVALGTEVPSFFTNDEEIAEKITYSSNLVGDPLWRLPLWENYENQLVSAHADFKNIGNSSFGGAITAALFLKKFVKDISWVHVDMMAWTRPNNFSSYEGGEAMGIRALLHFLLNNYN